MDNRPTQRSRGGPRRFGPNRFQQAQRQREAEAAAAAENKHRQPRKKQQKMMGNFQRYNQQVGAYGRSTPPPQNPDSRPLCSEELGEIWHMWLP